MLGKSFNLCNIVLKLEVIVVLPGWLTSDRAFVARHGTCAIKEVRVFYIM